MYRLLSFYCFHAAFVLGNAFADDVLYWRTSQTGFDDSFNDRKGYDKTLAPDRAVSGFQDYLRGAQSHHIDKLHCATNVLFALPEWYFRKFGVAAYTLEDRDHIVNGIQRVIETAPFRIPAVIIPGSIHFAVNISLNDIDATLPAQLSDDIMVYFNCAPVFVDTVLIKTACKQKDAGDLGRDVSMNELWGGTVPQRHDKDFEPYSEPWQVEAIAAAREKAKVTFDDPAVYTYPLGDGLGGIEICADHACGLLKRNGVYVDVQLLIASGQDICDGNRCNFDSVATVVRVDGDDSHSSHYMTKILIFNFQRSNTPRRVHNYIIQR